jgi:NitT/TauT family transport system ATP-binding protein
MKSIVLDHVCKKYSPDDADFAVEDVSLTISDGEFVTVLGPSGCGKSTLLEMVAGLSPHTSGHIMVHGRHVTGPSPKLGVVFQDPSLFPWRTIRDNVALGPELRKVQEKERWEMADKYLELVNLSGWGDKYPHELSGGMRQRAGIARTLVNDPEVLLMDEPLGAVDYLTRLTLQDEIVRIWQQEKKTIMFVTHDVNEAVVLGTRVVLMTAHPGRIRQVFEVPFDYPRDRNDPGVKALEEDILQKLNSDGQDNLVSSAA